MFISRLEIAPGHDFTPVGGHQSKDLLLEPKSTHQNTSISPGALRGFRASLIAQLVKNPLQCRRPCFDSWVVKICWRRNRLPTPVFFGFPCGSAGRVHLQCGRPGVDSWVGRMPRRREQLPTPIFWPGEFHGVYSPWHRKELDTTE